MHREYLKGWKTVQENSEHVVKAMEKMVQTSTKLEEQLAAIEALSVAKISAPKLREQLS